MAGTETYWNPCPFIDPTWKNMCRYYIYGLNQHLNLLLLEIHFLCQVWIGTFCELSRLYQIIHITYVNHTWLVVWNMIFFSIICGIILPNWLSYVSRWLKPATRYIRQFFHLGFFGPYSKAEQLHRQILSRKEILGTVRRFCWTNPPSDVIKYSYGVLNQLSYLRGPTLYVFASKFM